MEIEGLKGRTEMLEGHLECRPDNFMSASLESELKQRERKRRTCA
jgi:hypothetical protein